MISMRGTARIRGGRPKNTSDVHHQRMQQQREFQQGISASWSRIALSISYKVLSPSVRSERLRPRRSLNLAPSPSAAVFLVAVDPQCAQRWQYYDGSYQPPLVNKTMRAAAAAASSLGSLGTVAVVVAILLPLTSDRTVWEKEAKTWKIFQSSSCIVLKYTGI